MHSNKTGGIPMCSVLHAHHLRRRPNTNSDDQVPKWSGERPVRVGTRIASANNSLNT